MLVGEGLDTDRLVGKLDPDQQTALQAWYWWTGTVADRASDLGIHRDTLADRVKAAKRKLAELDSARHARPIKTVLPSVFSNSGMSLKAVGLVGESSYGFGSTVD